jgi:hypothetical protein
MAHPVCITVKYPIQSSSAAHRCLPQQHTDVRHSSTVMLFVKCPVCTVCSVGGVEVRLHTVNWAVGEGSGQSYFVAAC